MKGQFNRFNTGEQAGDALLSRRLYRVKSTPALDGTSAVAAKLATWSNLNGQAVRGPSFLALRANGARGYGAASVNDV